MADFTLEKLICSQQNLERVLDNLQEGIIAHDVHRRIFFFNQEAEKITGFARQDLLGKDCHEAFGAPFCGEQCSFCDASEPVRDTKHYTVNINTRDGETRRLAMTVTAMYDDGGNYYGVVTAFKDMTDWLRLKVEAGKLTRFDNIIGQDIKMLQVFEQIHDVSGYDFPVHITGETGTGKELVARAVHNESRRGGAPFVPINCGALPEGLIESELFGHVKGAFTGAIREKKGRFELAHNGTIFMDEVAELSHYMQVKLLRFLQEGSFEKVGGEHTHSVQVRVISATNKDLKQEVMQGRFREDLFYRLNVIPIHLPPLRERKTDIPLLIDHFLHETRTQYAQHPIEISRESLALMMDYTWPGNVRELQNSIQFAIVKCDGQTITPYDLPPEIREAQRPLTCAGRPSKLNQRAVRAALRKTGGNKAQAAKLLGVGRATLYRFLGNHPQMLQD